MVCSSSDRKAARIDRDFLIVKSQRDNNISGGPRTEHKTEPEEKKKI
jgi:hypothetical protein